MKGFTLFEIIVVVTIIAIASLVAMPAMQVYYQEHDLKLWSRQLWSSIKYARTAALSQAIPVAVLPLKQDWCNGVIIFKDGDESGRPSTEKDILKATRNPKSDHCQIIWRSFSNKPYLRFLPIGSTDSQNGSFSVFSEGDLVEKLIVSQTGRVRIQ